MKDKAAGSRWGTSRFPRTQVGERLPSAPGVTAVPERLRVLGFLDTALLWGNLGVSLLVLVAGALLVPPIGSLSFQQALLAVVVGGLIGNAMLGTAGLIGADARVPAMVLLRAPLGRRGSYAPTVVNVLQCLGWATFELIIIAVSAAALSDALFGFEARWLWTLVFGAIAALMALLGPVGVVRRLLRKVAVWAVPLSLAYLTWWALRDADLGALWSTPGTGGSIWLGIDLVVAITVTWIPLAADYTRFSRSRRDAFAGTFLGYLVPTFWMFGLGLVLVIVKQLSEATAIPPAVAAAGLAAALALLAVTIDEVDEAFANVYSAGVSLQNLLGRVPLRLLVLVSATIATLAALTVQLREYELFLLLLGSAFVPLFGVLLADWLLSGRHYGQQEVFGRAGVRAVPMGAWLVGFAAYHWLHEPPLGPAWWADLVERTNPPSLGIGATLPSFAVAFGLTALGTMLASGRTGAWRTSP